MVFEIDRKKVFELYKTYLVKYAEELTGSALLFPLVIKLRWFEDVFALTILNVKNIESSMTLTNDIKQGSRVKFMKSNLDKLVNAVYCTTENALINQRSHKPTLALLNSCKGRKLILGVLIKEDIEAIAKVLGSKAVLSGIYSYGKICPTNGLSKYQLHDQKMRIITFSEN